MTIYILSSLEEKFYLESKKEKKKAGEIYILSSLGTTIISKMMKQSQGI